VRSLRLSDRPAATKSTGAALAWFLCALLFLTTLAFGYRTYRMGPVAEQEATTAEPANFPGGTVPGAAAARPAAAPGDVVLESKGYVIPAHQIQVSPNKVSGILDYVDPRLEEGNQFREGQVLARIQDTDFRARRDKASKVLAECERRLRELETTYPEEVKQAEANIALMRAKLGLSIFKKQITRDAREASTREQLEETTLLADQDRASLESSTRALNLILASRKEQIEQARARVDQARHDLTEADWLLTNCEIKAPVTGTILKKNAERGNFVNPSALSGASGGIAVSLCDMADLADLEVELKIQERDIAKVIVGQPCQAMPEAFQNHDPFRAKYPNGYLGKVSRIMPIADRSQSAIPVRVKLDIPKDEEGVYLKPDMGVIVSFRQPAK
jgi:HlyD family secretion protein